MADLSGRSDISLNLSKMTLEDDELINRHDKPEIIDVSNFVEKDSNPSPDDNPEYVNNSKDFTFDNVIGHLEDMLIDEEFQSLQNSFLEKYWQEFDDSEENKHSYMTIFNEYTNKIEDFIVNYLTKRISNFNMDAFAVILEEKKNYLEGEIFEVLLTLSDFRAFKEIFLDYRQMKEGRTADLGKSLCISSVPL